MWPNEYVGETVSERLMYATAVLQGNTIQTFLLPPNPNTTPPHPALSVSPLCLIDVVDGEARDPGPFCSF